MCVIIDANLDPTFLRLPRQPIFVLSSNGCMLQIKMVVWSLVAS